jgi:hypothetical protein
MGEIGARSGLLAINGVVFTHPANPQADWPLGLVAAIVRGKESNV